MKIAFDFARELTTAGPMVSYSCHLKQRLKEMLTSRLGGLARPIRSMQHRRRYWLPAVLKWIRVVMELTIYVYGKYQGTVEECIRICD